MSLTSFKPTNKFENLMFTGKIQRYTETVYVGNARQDKPKGFIYNLLDLDSGYEINLVMLETNARPLKMGYVKVDGLTVSVRKHSRRNTQTNRTYYRPEIVIYAEKIENK